MEGIHIFMEDAEGAEWQDQICLAARSFRRLAPLEHKKAIGAVTFVPGKGRVTVPPIEAADLLAWHMRNRATYPEGKEHPAHSLLQSIKGNRVVLTEEHLEIYVHHVNAGTAYSPY